MSEWISIENRMPSDGKAIWVYDGYITIGCFFKDEGWCVACDAPVLHEGEWLIDSYELDKTMDPTHWMPLPEPPEDV